MGAVAQSWHNEFRLSCTSLFHVEPAQVPASACIFQRSWHDDGCFPPRQETAMGERLTAKERRNLPASDFGLPAQRKYPEENRGHAIAAESRAAQQVGKTITSAQKQEIDRKALRKLGK
jgi:hypothetical protein